MIQRAGNGRFVTPQVDWHIPSRSLKVCRQVEDGSSAVSTLRRIRI